MSLMNTYVPSSFLQARLFLMQIEINNHEDGDSSVTARDGTVYPRIPFESYQHARMAGELCDRVKADRIWQSYNTCLLPHLWGSREARVNFQKWLFENVHYLGCEPKRHLDEAASLLGLAPYVKELTQFFDQVACKEHSHAQEEKVKKISKRIFIITTSGGGGELTVTRALEGRLKQLGHQVKILDVEDFLGDDEDVLYRFSKGIYSGDIWGTFYQGENNPDLANHLWGLCGRLKRFIPNQSSFKIKNAIKEFAPDLILSMRYSIPSDLSFGHDLNIPLRFVHCDYRFAPELKQLLVKTNLQRVKFWVPAAECIPSGFEEHVQVLGYPTRSGIVKETSPQKLLEIRESLGIQSFQKVIVIMMGRQGFSKGITSLIEQIRAADGKFGFLYVAVICGNNTEMKKELEMQLQMAGPTREVSFHLYGLVNEQLVSDFLNVTTLFIGKTGGATTSELAYMGVHALVPESYELEIANFEYLVSHGLATRLIENCLVDQIKTLLSSKTCSPPKITSWKENLVSLIE